jgi:hypothetical protein
MNELRFDDITPIEEKVFIGGDEYVLREMSGDAAVKYDNARLNRYEYQDGKLAKVRNLADLEPLLVSLCLFMADGVTPVSETTVRAWPARVQRSLHSRAREISGMNEPSKTIEEQIEILQRQLAESKTQEELPKK